MSYVSECLLDSPDYLFLYNEPSGAFADSSGHGYTATEFTLTATRSVTGPTQVGSNGITVPAGERITTNFSALSKTAETVEAWIKTTDTNLIKVSDGRGGVGAGISLAIGATGFGAAAGAVTAYINTTSYWHGLHSAITVNDGAWHHLIGTFFRTSGAVTASDLELYIDGVVIAATGEFNGSGVNAPIGSENYSIPLNSAGAVSLSAMAFYSTKLSAARIAAHAGGFPTPVGRSYAAMVG
jgi:hypothetical protein